MTLGRNVHLSAFKIAYNCRLSGRDTHTQTLGTRRPPYPNGISGRLGTLIPKELSNGLTQVYP